LIEICRATRFRRSGIGRQHPVRDHPIDQNQRGEHRRDTDHRYDDPSSRRPHLLGISQDFPDRNSPKVRNPWIDAIAAGADVISKTRFQVESVELAAVGAGLVPSVTMEPQSGG
jgi:hypothetical protein